MNNYKHTLNLPTTTFPMRGNLLEKEPNIIDNWDKKNIYKKICDSKKGKKIFILHDGPPYANGKIHIGHAINKVIKDIIIKSKWLNDYYTPYIPGWDCHGLPIEHKVEQLIKKKYKKINNLEFQIFCRQYANTQINKQKKDFIRLGVIADWSKPYLTMDFSTEANIIRIFKKIVSNNYLQRKIKPVYWCIKCLSTLAEAEVEYYNINSTSIYISFLAVNRDNITAKFNINNFNGNIFIITWTTTPWTLPANVAISLHPNLDYLLIQKENNCYIIAANLAEQVMSRIGIINWKILSNIKGKELQFEKFFHPFMNYDVPIILSENVKFDVGTGIIHIAPAYGLEDYNICKKYNLKIKNIITDSGYYVVGTHILLDNINIFNANKIIIEILRKVNCLLHLESITHNYPHCWRHKKPIIFRATPQWFINLDKNKLREQVIKNIESINWIPSWSKETMKTMVLNRPDWCISRQRIWGVPMSLFINKNTNEIHYNSIELMEIIAKLVEKKGAQVWFDLEIKKILGDEHSYYYKLLDTLDVWFDSGCTSKTMLQTRPCFMNSNSIDLYVEGSDQYRGWFMSSLVISSAINNKNIIPRSILTHGFAIDKNGNKMSKSVGNVISPEQIINKFGADILRIWVAFNDYTKEIAISDEIIQRSVDYYRRIRNTFRFILANLNNFDSFNDIICPEKMIMVDRWAVNRMYITQKEIINFYEKYDFYSVVQRIMQFCSIDMGSFYLDIIKDRKYTTKKNSIAHKSCQTALYHIIESLVRLIAPIISFTADEIWNFMKNYKKNEFIFMDKWYDGLFILDPSHVMNDDYWCNLLLIRSEINKFIEKAKNNKIIKSSLEACIFLYAEPNIAKQLRYLNNELPFLLITSQAHIINIDECNEKHEICNTSINGLKVFVRKAEGKKCPRCWHYENNIGENEYDKKICNRCVKNIYGLGEKRNFI